MSDRRRIVGIRTPFVAMAGLLALTLVILYIASEQSRLYARRIALHDRVIQRMQATFSELQDAETGQRGYLLTAEPIYLEPYRRALEEIPGHMSELSVMAARELAPADLTQEFRELVGRKLHELAETVDMARNGDPAQALKLVESNIGLRVMDQVRTTFELLIQDQRTRREQAVNASREAGKRAGLVFVAVTLLNLAFLAWAYFRIRREFHRAREAGEEVHRGRQLLATSLACIGDAVILTDTAARITFMNSKAEELTGWTLADAAGLPGESVFRIIHESSRETMESPVSRVLATGEVAALANHALLIRRDGFEIPVDDCGAPVRDHEGNLLGVVLVFRDFTEHKEAEKVLREVRDRLETANRAKDEFIITLSHELRTPLTPVLATLSSWEVHERLPEPLRNDLQLINRNLAEEVRLIDALLDFTQIVKGRLSMKLEALDVHEILQSVAGALRSMMDARGIRCGLRLAAGDFSVSGDVRRLRQVFWNILQNATKFAPEGGRIEVVTRNEDRVLRIDFADNGRGMTPETIAGLFDGLDGIEWHHPTHPVGLGIGLTLSKGIVEAHGGSIEGRSDGPSFGSTFIVRLPLAPSDRRPLRTVPEGEKKSLQILVVEDHTDTAVVIQKLLQGIGHVVRTVGTLEDGLAALRSASWDLILADIGLPDGDGVEFLQRTREFCQTPMVVLTGYTQPEDMERYREQGFVEQLSKPIRIEQLEACIGRFRKAGG